MALPELLDVAQTQGAAHSGAPAPAYVPAPALGNNRGDWATGVHYYVNDLVRQPNGELYRCMTEHVSGATFAGDTSRWADADTSSGGSGVIYGAGAPASGTGSDGQSYVDTSTNRLYGPKAGGAWPGTYIRLGQTPFAPGYAEVTDATSGSGTNSRQFTAAGSDITGLQITVDASGRPILLEAWCPFMAPKVTAESIALCLFEGATELALAQSYGSAANVPGGHCVVVKKFIAAPSVGSHTYKAVGRNISGTGGGYVYGLTNAPAYILATEL